VDVLATFTGLAAELCVSWARCCEWFLIPFWHDSTEILEGV